MKLFEKSSGWFYLIARIIFSVLFFMHGLQKFGNGTPSGMMLWAGIIEIVVGLALFLGLLVRPMALLGAIEMLVAYFIAHAPQGYNPLANKGELSLLYFAAFLIFAAYGAGKLSLERALLKREVV